MTEHDKLRHPECGRCIDWQDSIDDAVGAFPVPFIRLRKLALFMGLCPHGSDSDCPELVVQEQHEELIKRIMEPPLLEGTGDRVTRTQHGYRST